MPSLLHEALVLLVRNHPLLAADLAALAGIAAPTRAGARLVEASLPEILPTPYAADAVVVLGEPEPQWAIVVEAQLAIRRDKRFTWPLYAAALRARLRVPVALVVVTPRRAVARWASARIQLGPGHHFAPIVIGPDRIPVVTDPADATRHPERAVLSAIAHGKTEHGLAIAQAAMAAAGSLDEERGPLYADIVYAALDRAARATLEKLMERGNWQWQSPFARKHFAAGRAEGLAEGEARGKAEGLIEGEARAKADALLAVLAARNLELTGAQRQRILQCRDLDQLDTWIQRAVRADSLDDLLP